MTLKPVPRALYLTGASDPEYMICVPDGRCWDLYEGMDMIPAVGGEGWRGWDWHPGCTATRVEIARDLSDEEIASLAASDTRPGAVAAILAARSRQPTRTLSDDQAEIERWRKAAERAEADRQEWQALALNHEGAIERLTRERDAARESLSATSTALRVARAEADEAHRRADAAEPEVERLRGIVVALAARLAGL